MPDIATAVLHSDESHQRNAVSRQRHNHRTIRTTSPARLNILAPAAALALPSLAGVDTFYEYIDGNEQILSLLRRFAEQGIATATTKEDILRLKKSPYKFLQDSFHSWLNSQGGLIIDKNITYDVSISTKYGSLRDNTEEGNNKPALVITAIVEECGYMAVRPVLDMLEKREKGLGRTWYEVMSQACWKWMCLYDLNAAMRHVEYEKECFENNREPIGDSDEPDATEELPDIASELPKYLRKPKKITARDIAKLRRHAKSHNVGALVRRVLEIHRLSLEPKAGDCLEIISAEFDYVSNPSVLVVMTPNDNIQGSFDVEAQSMWEGSPEPCLAVAFDPESPTETQAAIRSLQTFLNLNRELSLLIHDMDQLDRKRTNQ
jgi:hypothetical protein